MSDDEAAAERRTIAAPAAHVARRLEAAARDGFEPLTVTLRSRGEVGGRDDLDVDVVLARRGSGSSWRRVLVGPVPFRDGDRLGLGHAPRPHDRGWVASVAVAGAATDDAGTGLWIAFVWCIDPGRHVPWGVHLHPLAGEALHAAPTVRVLARQGSLVEAHPVALPAGAGTLSLWHGRDARPSAAISRSSAASPRTTEAPAGEAVGGWVVAHMHRIAARHAQVVVVRDGHVVKHEAYAAGGDATGSDPITAPGGAPHAAGGGAADPDLAMRLGSVSKVVTGLVAAGLVRRLGLPRGLDTPIGELGVLRPGGSPTLPRVTLAQLLDHTAGLVTSPELRPDDERHPLSELRIARDRGTPETPLRPGDLLRWFEEHPDDRVFVREPGSGRPEYGNEGAILLGEILSRLALGREDAFEALVTRLFEACGVEVGERGCLLGAGVARSQARHEATPQATSITWAPARFDPDREVVPTPHADNGPYLGGAAGLAVPLAWMGALLATIGRRDGDPGAPTRADLDALVAPAPRDPRFGRGVMRGSPAYLPLRRSGASMARPVRVLPMHHLGRIDGGSALLLHLLPLDPGDGTGLAAVVAFDRLGPLEPAVEGAALLAVLRPLAAAPDC